MKILVSACLLGRNCKYNGGNNQDERVLGFVQGHEVIAVCPEELAGLGTPRIPIEIKEGIVVNREGKAVDASIRAAVAELLSQLEGKEIDLAILKARSPTCGVKQVYDGSFSGTLTDGSGVLAEALKKAGYKVMDNEDI